MLKTDWFVPVACVALLLGLVSSASAASPNIIYILADDLGYGDVHCMDPERGKIATPRMDTLASEGMIFSDAHTSSSVCTPTRYSILTGRYNWRTRLQRSVLYGFSPPLIARDRLTVAGFLRGQGYNTACIGKWHLGLDMPTTNGKPADRNGSNVDWKGVLSDTPVHHGFDYFHGISASLDMPPYIYIQNDRFVGACTTTKAFHRNGPAHADFEAVDVLPEIGRKSVKYIQAQKAEKPFFMYIALTSPHTPIVPPKAWQGKSPLGTYADFVMQTDHVIGVIADAVDAAGFGPNTLFIVTSDNGCSAKRAGADELKAKGHYPSAQYRGYKSDIWDGGHRVPFIVRWPDAVAAGAKSEQTVCLTDLMATCADILGTPLPGAAGEDSVSFLPALKGNDIESTRKGIIHHSIRGAFAYREGKWKLVLTKGSGGWSASPKAGGGTEGKAGVARGQLYDMEADPGETKNLYVSHPEVVEGLLARVTQDVESGRSTEGPVVKNDVDVIKLWK